MMTNEEEKTRKKQLEQMGFNWKEAYLPGKNDPRSQTQVGGIIAIIVPDKNEVEQVYLCLPGSIPEGAKHLFKDKR